MEEWQYTLAKEITYEGPGLHSGEEGAIRCLPAPPHTGILFIVEQEGRRGQFKASPRNVLSTNRCTTLGAAGVKLHTVEHILAAARGMGLDNLIIEAQGKEIPIADGSALVYARLFLEAGLKKQEAFRSFWEIHKPLSVSCGSMRMEIFPDPTFRISYTFVTDHPVVGVQTEELTIDRETFLKEIAPARTFGFAEEVESLKEQGLIQGGSLDHALLIGREEIIGELRLPKEMARHKILDIIGDMALTVPIKGHIVALCSGHTLDVELVRKIEGVFKEGVF